MTSFSRAAIALAAACITAPLNAQARTPAPTKDSTQVAYDDDGLRIHSARSEERRVGKECRL